MYYSLGIIMHLNFLLPVISLRLATAAQIETVKSRAYNPGDDCDRTHERYVDEAVKSDVISPDFFDVLQLVSKITKQTGKLTYILQKHLRIILINIYLLNM